jgi:hypothetical protein
MVYTILLIIHISGGSLALLSAVGAISTKIFDIGHIWHVWSGRLFFIGMTLVFLTTVPMTLLKPNLFLFLIGIFSFYLAWTGWRKAVNRPGVPQKQDYAGVIIMGATGMVMIGWGGWLIAAGEGNGITLMVFGGIGGFLSISEFKQFRRGQLKGKERIRAHLVSMMAATIAAVTAFLVVNVETDPVWIAWLLPTIIITPLIVWMSRWLLPKRA